MDAARFVETPVCSTSTLSMSFGLLSSTPRMGPSRQGNKVAVLARGPRHERQRVGVVFGHVAEEAAAWRARRHRARRRHNTIVAVFAIDTGCAMKAQPRGARRRSGQARSCWFPVAITLSLLLTVAAVGAGTGLARSATSTSVAGINVDGTTIPELQAFMDLHRLSFGPS